MTIAIAYLNQPTSVAIWCDAEAPRRDGTRHFHVINGGWHGHIQGQVLFVEGDPTEIPAKIVWEGSVPQHYDYNEAIEWIESEIKKGKGL